MCDSATQNAIDSVVSEITSPTRPKMFTALDVTKLVWAKLQTDAGGDPSERWPAGYHKSIKNDIHDALSPFIQSCAYERDIQNIPGLRPDEMPPFVYHPIGSDPDCYTGTICDAVIDSNINPASLPSMITGVNPLAAALAATSPAPALIAPVIGGGGTASDGYARNLTPYSRLTVPSVLIRKMGVTEGDKVYLLVGNNQCTLVEPQPDSSTNYRSYIVDQDCNVRISASHLAKAGMDTAQQFKFRMDGATIVIEQA